MNKKQLFPITLLWLAFFLFISNVIILFKFNKIVFKTPFGDSFSIFSLFQGKRDTKYIIYGYLPYWQLETTDYLQFDKLTDIAYFGLYIDEKGNFQTKNAEGYNEPGYENWKNNDDIKKLISKSKKYNVRFSLTIISHEDTLTDKFLDCETCWENLKKNVVSELKSKNIKDLNINFEYVNFPDEDKTQKFTQFVNYMNKELDKEFNDSFVVVSTFADSLIKPRVSDPEELAKVADKLFIMGYDFHRPTSDQAGPIAPIFGKGVYAEYDIDTMLTDYLAKVPSEKLILGVPYYGYNWVVEDKNQYSKRIPGNDSIGYSQSQSYTAIMDTIVELKPEVLWDDLAKAPYFSYISPETGQIRQVYFENDKSLSEKYSLVKAKGLGGVGIWALGYDGGYTELWNLLGSEFFD